MKPAHQFDDAGWCAQAVCTPSPNFDERPHGSQPTMLVIHNISLPPNQFGGQWITDLFQNNLNPTAHPYFELIHTFEVSSHFLIRRDGELIQYVSCDQRAWHAGASMWRGQSRCNDFAIGIELEGADGVPFTSAQYKVLSELTQSLKTKYPSIDSVAGHSEIAPSRKTDPGTGFEWARYESEAGIPNEWRENHTSGK